MDALIEQPIAASALVRDAMTRLLSSVPRGFTPDERKALSDYDGPIQSGHASDEMVEDEE